MAWVRGWSRTSRILGITPPTSTLQGLLKHQDLVLRAARTVRGVAEDLIIIIIIVHLRMQPDGYGAVYIL